MLVLTAVVLWSNLPLLALSDNLELLSTSLRRLQKSGCHELSLSCPQGTSIALVSAKYSENVFCPGVQNNVDCQLPKLLQYSLLQTAVERCQKKRHCKLTPSASYGSDPCPGLAKHLLITYSCRPFEFRSKLGCDNEVVQLQCNPNSRIAVYSASYGRTEYESMQCPQPQGVPEETCLASYTTETVISLCHGKRRCTLSVNSRAFGTPCKEESRMYLKVVYTCVARGVLESRHEEGRSSDEPMEPPEWLDYDEEGKAAPNTSSNQSVTVHHGDQGVTPTLTSNEEEKSTGKVQRDLRLRILPDSDAINCTVNIIMEEKKSVIGFVSEWITAYNFLTNNKERLTLYLAVSIGGGLICLLVLLVTRMACTRRNNGTRHTIPRFSGEIYDGETDLTAANSLPPDPSEVVRYSTGNSQYYYG